LRLSRATADSTDGGRQSGSVDCGPYRILVVEDDALMRSAIVDLLYSEGYETSEASTEGGALSILGRQKTDLILLDVDESSGLGTLGRFRNADPDTLIISAHASVESGVIAVREGAYDYITKPFANEHLKAVIRRALAEKALLREYRLRQLEPDERHPFPSIIGTCEAMQRVFQLMQKVAPTEASVLIIGEPGTGKELVVPCTRIRSGPTTAFYPPIAVP
jgi:DNA-binding NtrC family response regulator